MKKLALVLAILMVAAFSVQASDLKIKGSYRAVGTSDDNGYGAANTDAHKWVDQRFRVQADWKVNDNVSTQLRTDITEGTWDYALRPTAGTNDQLMIDRASATIKSGVLKTTVGLQNVAWGLGSVLDDQGAGISASIDINPVTLNLMWAKVDENTTNLSDDIDIYGIAAAYKTDAFTATIGYVTYRDDSAAFDTDKNAYFATVIAPIGDMTLSAEAATFSGDSSSTVEYTGTQLYAQLAAKLTDTISGDVAVVWADEADGTTETQEVNISKDNAVKFHPLDFGGALAVDQIMVTNDDKSSNGYGSAIFEQGDNNGVLGVIGSVKVAATSTVTLYGKLAYLEPSKSVTLDSKFIANGSIDYAWMPAVVLSAGAYYCAPSYSDSTNDDNEFVGVVRLGVSF